MLELTTMMEAAQVAPQLFQGPVPVGKADPRFQRIVNLVPWPQYAYEVEPHVVKLAVKMYDHEAIPPEDLLYDIADIVNVWRTEHDVFVHCQAGLNRSGLICALSLIRSGLTPQQAIKMVRDARGPMALCNPHFVRWLESQGG